MVVNTLGSLIKTEDSIVSVNFERKKTEASEKHNELFDALMIGVKFK